MRSRYLKEALGVAACFLAVPISATLLHADDSSQAIAQIRSAASSYLQAPQSGDADRIAAFWTSQGTFVDASNNSYEAQELVRLEFPQHGTPQPQSGIVRHSSTIRLITPNVALERGDASATEADANATPETSHLALWVRQDERWLLDFLKEFHVASRPAESRLAQLQWMVGQWESTSAGFDARLTVTWSDQQRYLMQRFTVQLPDQDELRVEQRIAWDASNQQIRSWLFRSDGGFAEGVWSLKGETWVVNKSEVMPNGDKINTVNFWVHEDPDSCWFKSLSASAEAEPAEDLVLQFRRTDGP